MQIEGQGSFQWFISLDLRLPSDLELDSMHFLVVEPTVLVQLKDDFPADLVESRELSESFILPATQVK